MTVGRAGACVLIASLVCTGPAEARFGRRTSGGASSSASGGSSSGGTGSFRPSGGSSAGSFHRAAPVGSVPPSSFNSWNGNPSRGWTGSSWGWGPTYRPWRAGYWSGAFVPSCGYGWGYYYAPPAAMGAAVVTTPTIQQEPSGLRVAVGAEGLYSLSATNGGGFVLGASALFEGERLGVSILAQTIQTQLNQLSQLNAHLTFAFLTGRYGRLRVELGADTLFARDLIVMAPTGGISGQLWIAGPVALEGAVFVTPWPIWQLDYRAGVVLGVDSIGIRAGFRSQTLEDRGIVSGVPEDTTGCQQLSNGNWSCRDVVLGPYVGIGVVF
ncbi:MAG: hypothetical protein INH37_21420 [Myxococcaceae bacterium]|nr:hypothetical protein [Myxococcaceae bacterium]